MRKILGPLLLGVGGFLLTTALLVLLWVPGQVKKTPLNVDSLTTLTGDASYLGSDRAPVKATSHTVTDGDASSSSINASTDAFATDRKTGLALSDQEKYLGANASPHDGLVNKFPFGAEQKTYPFWDGILKRAVDAAFVGEEDVNGLATNKYQIKITDEAAEISSGVQGTYSNDKTMWVDPMTGSIIKQTEVQKRVLPDGTAALDMQLAFTDEQIQANVDDAKANGGKLGLVGKLPWIAGLLGLIAAGLGMMLGRQGDGDDETPAAIAVTRTEEAPAAFGSAEQTRAIPTTEQTAPRRINLEKD